jgi:hypothetical protein
VDLTHSGSQLYIHPRSGAVLRIRDVYPGSWFLPIPDPGSKNSNERQGWKKIFIKPFFFGAINFTNLNYFIVEMLKKKILANFQRIVEIFTQKLSLSSQKYGFGIQDPGSGKNLFRIPDPGVKKAPDPGSGSATLFRSSRNSCSLEMFRSSIDMGRRDTFRSSIGACRQGMSRSSIGSCRLGTSMINTGSWRLAKSSSIASYFHQTRSGATEIFIEISLVQEQKSVLNIP